MRDTFGSEVIKLTRNGGEAPKKRMDFEGGSPKGDRKSAQFDEYNTLCPV